MNRNKQRLTSGFTRLRPGCLPAGGPLRSQHIKLKQIQLEHQQQSAPFQHPRLRVTCCKSASAPNTNRPRQRGVRQLAGKITFFVVSKRVRRELHGEEGLNHTQSRLPSDGEPMREGAVFSPTERLAGSKRFPKRREQTCWLVATTNLAICVWLLWTCSCFFLHNQLD